MEGETEDEKTDEVRMKFGSTLKEEDVDVWFRIDKQESPRERLR